MSGSVRTRLTVGIAAITASAVVLAPTTPPTSRPDAQELAAPPVALAAAVEPLVVTPLTHQQLDTARTVIGRLDPTAAGLLPPPAPAPRSAASNSIASVYEWAQDWVSYGVDLAQYVLQFIPYGYLIGDQIGIVYDTLVLPISDSVVYDLIIPVVNDPLNLSSYVNGAVAVGSTTVTALINFGIAEFNNFFGWLIPPLPPLPFAATEPTTLTALKLAAAPTAQSTEPIDDPAVPAEHELTTGDVVDADAPTAAEPVTPEDPAAPADPVDAVNTVEPAAAETLPEPTETQTPAEPVSVDVPTAEAPADQATDAEPAPVTPKPETEPAKATGTTTKPADKKPHPSKPHASKADASKADASKPKDEKGPAKDAGNHGARHAEKAKG